MNTAPNPKDSMKSTWRRMDRAQWSHFHKVYDKTGIYPTSIEKPVPVHSKDSKVPHMPGWTVHRWVLVHAFIPIAVHFAYASLIGCNPGPIAAFLFYTLSYHLIGIHELQVLGRLGYVYGFFDGNKHHRDGVPDVGVARIIQSLVSTASFRTLMTVVLSYHRDEPPTSIRWAWLPIEIGLYGIVLDFWFYWYHRLMHQVGTLWRYHRTHHLTKYPNSLLTLYADTEQEIFDIVGIPLITYFTLRLLGVPMGFYEWWVCHQYVVFAELAGHSGLRFHATTPSTLTWLLEAFDAELVIEDHDLHHRYGFKKSHNYGKQTRLWDRVFGTCRDRIECLPHNIDYENQAAPFPLL